MTHKETPTISYWATTVGLMLVALTPCIISYNMFFPYITGKAFYFRAIVLVLVLTYLLAAWQTKQLRARLSPMLVAFTVLLVGSTVSAILAPDSIKSFWSNFERMEGVVGLAALYIFFIIAGSLWRSTWTWATYAYAWLAVNTIAALRGIYEMIVGFQAGESVRADSFLGNATYFAAAMLLSICIAGTLYFVPSLAKYRWVSYIGIPLYLIALVGTGTRGAMLGLIVGIVVAVFLYAMRKGASREIRITAIGLPVLVVLFFGALYVARDSAFVSNVQILDRFAQIYEFNPQAQTRPTLWGMALTGFFEKPIFGWGLENFNYVFNINYDPSIANHEQWFDRTHNIFFDWLVSTGIIGLGAYLFLLGSTIWCVWRLSSLTYLQKSLITGSIVAYVIHNCFVFDNLISAVMFYSFVAFVHSQYVVERQEREALLRGKEQKDVRERSESREKKVGYIYAGLFFVSLVAVPVGIAAVVVMPMSTNKFLLKGYSYFSAIKPDMTAATKEAALKEGIDAYNLALETEWLGAEEVREQYIQSASALAHDFSRDAAIGEQVNVAVESSLNETKALIEDYPENARFYQLLSIGFARLGRYDEAIAALERATEYSPKKANLYEDMVRAYHDKGEYGKALERARYALSLNENNTRAQVLFIRALLYMTQFNEAKTFIGAHPELFNNPQIVQVYLERGRYADMVELMPAALSQYDVNRLSAYTAQDKLLVSERYLAYSAALLEVGRRDDALAAMGLARQFAEQHPDQLKLIDTFVASVRAGKTSILR